MDAPMTQTAPPAHMASLGNCWHTMRVGSATKVLAKRMLKYLFLAVSKAKGQGKAGMMLILPETAVTYQLTGLPVAYIADHEAISMGSMIRL